MENAKILELIKAKFPEAVIDDQDCRGDLQVTVAKDAFMEMMTFLHDDPQLSFDLLIDVLSIDNSERRRQPRFEVVYVLLSTASFARLLVKVPVPEGEEMPSVIGIWQAADFPEREVFDMMGIRFAGHPDLRRILTWDDFDGNPLLKDFPLLGKDFDEVWDPDTIEVR
ncbi:MAG: NADH-quinone oxidoreductase subunit C [Deltaproteobacteria bacterium]|nr:NADH-quinone oxidoreductase subunit C [Candidatus Anaeroferrophillus wilburensis]MBN2889213.1 NADH-quinone oxidoreductase subunit C [Deltaproteobacteria bacterium]